MIFWIKIFVVIVSVSFLRLNAQELFLDFNKKSDEYLISKIFSDLQVVNGQSVVWVFEFAHKDSITLSTILNHYADVNPHVSLDTILIGTVSDNKLSGLYLADLIDTNQYGKSELVEKIKSFKKIFNKTGIRLSGVGFHLPKNQSSSHIPANMNWSANSEKDVTLKGSVVDASNLPMPYVSIGIENSNVGTVSDKNGQFTIVIPSNEIGDSISFSSVGYSKIKKSIQLLGNGGLIIVQMQESTYVLEEIIVDSKRFNKKIVLGSKKVGNQFGFVQGTGAGAEAARLLDPKKKVAYLNNAAIYVWNKKKRPFKFMVNVYEQDSLTGLPGKNLMKKPLVVESSISKGWLEADLNGQNLVVEKPFFISFQWLDENLKHPLIALKGSKAFVRPTSFGNWIETKDFNWAIKVEATIVE